MLGITRAASDADIKKAYRKEALRWHPDKNPDKKELAEKRFKEVSQAFKILSDPDERAHYDRYGQERSAGGGGGPRHSGHRHHHGMDAEDLTPEDIFNMFFGMPPRGRGGGGGFHHHQQQRHHQHTRHHHTQPDVNVNIVQLAPFALLLLFSLLSSLPFGGESTPYSLLPGEGHTLERSTESLGVRYFVGDEFELSHQDALSLSKVEKRIEADNLQRVRRRCNAERLSKQKTIDAANAYQGPERARKLEAADALDMRWCSEKDRLEAVRF